MSSLTDRTDHSFAYIADMIAKAKNQDEVDLCEDWVRHIEHEAQRVELRDLLAGRRKELKREEAK